MYLNLLCRYDATTRLRTSNLVPPLAAFSAAAADSDGAIDGIRNQGLPDTMAVWNSKPAP